MGGGAVGGGWGLRAKYTNQLPRSRVHRHLQLPIKLQFKGFVHEQSDCLAY